MPLFPRTVPSEAAERDQATLQRRWDQIRPRLMLALLILPIGQVVLFGGLMIGWVVLPGVLLTLVPTAGVILVVRQLRRGPKLITPSEWTASVALNAILSIPIVLLPLTGTAAQQYSAGFRGALVLAIVLIPVICRLLVWQARRILMAEPLRLVAASDFVLDYRLRSNRWFATITLDKDRLHWEAWRNSLARSYGVAVNKVDVSSSIPLAAVRDVSLRIVHDTEGGRVWMRGHLWRLRIRPGPALVLHTHSGEWVLPMTRPEALKPVLLARAEHIRARIKQGTSRPEFRPHRPEPEASS
ncbi:MULTISPECIES: hypothetical protein [Actinoalloteichus]|uniref:Uncharacterized protein n=1 Tax=Actinoalloteichus fjordicus TaxID=1612552 RepID=A0AAC9PR05_9PSEU|nr:MULTISPECIES: hypothetical protein [Actinoalloteichus]APU13341.1 hypothetical protein UA74_06340 [Actinoalloteichus fjordicus]APU19291.1 hypothetical protein UA75_06340 [Actinoalloteichus sp. GBA129-24]